MSAIERILAKLPAADALWLLDALTRAARSANPLRTLERALVARLAKEAIRR